MLSCSMCMQVRTENEMVNRSIQFEQAISGGDKSMLLSYCQQQEQQSSSQEAETWRFLRVNIEDDARRSIALVWCLCNMPQIRFRSRCAKTCLPHVTFIGDSQMQIEESSALVQS